MCVKRLLGFCSRRALQDIHIEELHQHLQQMHTEVLLPRKEDAICMYLMPAELHCLALCLVPPMQSVVKVVAVVVLVTACLQRC